MDYRLRRIRFIDVLILAALIATVSQTFAEELVLDLQHQGRTFEGIGAVSAGGSSRLLIDYPEPQRSAILDYLFKPGYGASLQHLKVEIGGGINSTSGTEPTHMRTPTDVNFTRGYEWWLMKEAKKRNPDIVLDCLAWGAPMWIGNGHYYSQDMADYIANFIIGAKEQHGLDITYTGLWNEEEYDIAWVKLLRTTLDRRGLSRVKIVAADQGSTWSVGDALISDPEFAAVVDVLGAHYTPQVPANVIALGKPLWASEAGVWDATWWGAIRTASLLNHNYLDGKITKTEIWSPISSYYDILPHPNSGLMLAKEPWSGHYEVQPGVWSVAHTTQFVRPGWKYLEGGASRVLSLGGSVVALVSPDNHDYAVILETLDASAPQKLDFVLTNGVSRDSIKIWRSSETNWFEKVAEIPTADGKFSWTFDPECIYTLTTLSSGLKGSSTQPPARDLFPLPYYDDFQQYESGATPRYFSDQSGTFEVAQMPGAQQKVLRQVNLDHGIPWVRDQYTPFTFLGDNKLRDYEISCDMLLESEGFATIAGRIEDASHVTPTGYIVHLYSSPGRWELWKGEELFTNGLVAFPAQAWHNVRLQFHGTEIQLVVDNKTVWKDDDSTYSSGMVALGCGWHATQYRNFRIAPLHLSPDFALSSTVTASTTWTPEFPAELLIDGNTDTYWTSDWSSEQQWAEFDFSGPRNLSAISIWEFPLGHRIQEWHLQSWTGTAWQELLTGGVMDKQHSFSFPRARSDKFRFYVTHAVAPPLVREIQLFDDPPQSNLVINEWLTPAEGVDAGDSPAWIEIYNSGPEAIDATGYRLIGSGGGELIFPPRTIIASRQYLVIGKGTAPYINIDASTSALSFTRLRSVTLLNGGGELVDHVEFCKPQGGSLGSSSDGGFLVAALAVPTPGASNNHLVCSISRDASQPNTFRIRCEGAPSQKYTLQRKHSLSDNEWGVAAEKSSGFDGIAEFVDLRTESSSIYRVFMQP